MKRYPWVMLIVITLTLLAGGTVLARSTPSPLVEDHVPPIPDIPRPVPLWPREPQRLPRPGDPDCPDCEIVWPGEEREPPVRSLLVQDIPVVNWQAKYWNNTKLQGPPVLQRTDPKLDFEWADGSPDPVVNPDYFSARWIGNYTFEEGLYWFHMFHDDGVRLWIDGEQVFSLWEPGRREDKVAVYLTEGTHQMRVEMYEGYGWASMRLWWERAPHDVFGYSLDDTAPFQWVDATQGTDTGLNGRNQQTGPIDIGFPFKFYEHTYTQIYISTNGTVGFDGQLTKDEQSLYIPLPSLPNDVIAPYWAPEDASTGGVYYRRGGTAPNRWLAVEWHQVKDFGPDSRLTFEVILHENGDIRFQYKTIDYDGPRWTYDVGIEDARGLDGLEYAGSPSEGQAIRIYRPAPAARALVLPRHQGQFVYPGASPTFQLCVQNTGELGEDTYDLVATEPWKVSLLQADGVTPLTDTDSDGLVDTGPIAQGEGITVTVQVQVPPGADVGRSNLTRVTARSSLDTGKEAAADLKVAVPAPFAQVLKDNADYYRASLYLAQPQGQKVQRTNEHLGAYPAIVETPDGNFLYAWSEYRCLDSSCSAFGCEIAYTLLGPLGTTLREATRLTDHSGAAHHTYDYLYGVAAAPNGRLGMVWIQNESRYTSNWQERRNVYFAILDASGEVVLPPVNLTQNDRWFSYDPLTMGVPRFYDASIGATDDNRFVLAWVRDHYETHGTISDVYYTVRNSNGGVVEGITRLTDDEPDWASFRYPNVARLSRNRALLTYSGRDGDIWYAVLNSDGSLAKRPANLVGDGALQFDYAPDAVELANNMIVVAWIGGQYPDYQVRYAVLNRTYGRRAGPFTLSNPAATASPSNLSVTADDAGHAILTWQDGNWSYTPHLYYALVDASGVVVTPPMIFYTSQGMPPRVETGYAYGNTTYTWRPPAGVDGRVSATGRAGFPGGTLGVSVTWDNVGKFMAEQVVMTATFDSALTYFADTSDVEPTVEPGSLTWSLPDTPLFGRGAFTFWLAVPTEASAGTTYPIQVQLGSAGPEANPADNVANVEGKVGSGVWIPLVISP